MSPTSEIHAAPIVPAPRFANGIAAAVYALAVLALAYPALAGQFLVNPMSDQYIAGYAFRDFAAQALRAGQGFPQWNPYLFGGMPYIAAMHGDIFYPTFLLRMMLPTDQAMTWGFIIHLFLAGFFTYSFLRAWGLGFYGSLVGGLAYMLSGPIAGYASPGHDGKLFVSALLPLALWMLVRGIRDGRAWAWGMLALTVGLAMLSPHPQLLQYLLLVSGAFSLFLAFSRHAAPGTLPPSTALKRLALAAGSVAVGVTMGAVQYLPGLFEYEPWSPRAGGRDYAHAVSYSLPPEELLNAFVPQFSGMLDRYWGRNGIHLHSEYAGVVVLVLATAGLFAGGIRQGSRFRWFWAGTFVVSLVWALGGYTPFYHLVYNFVPFTKVLRAPSTMMFLSMFSLAVLAGLGAERVLESVGATSRRFLIGWVVAIVAIGLVVSSGLAISMATGVGTDMAAARQNDAYIQYYADLARGNQGALALGALRSIGFVLATAVLIWMVGAGRVTRRAATWMLVALVGMDLWSIERKYWMFSPPARVLFASDPAIEAIKSASEPGRVVAADPIRAAAERDPAFGGDAFMVHGIRNVAGYHGNELGRYQEVLTRGSRYFRGDRPEFWRHENVRYLYTTVPDSLMPQLQSQLGIAGQFARVMGPVQNAAGTTVYLYRVPGDNPMAWVAAAVVKGTDEQALATVLDSRFDPQRAAIVDTAARVSTANLSAVPAPTGVKASVSRNDPGSINVQLDKPVPSGAALVVSENYFPGWRATVGGQSVPVVRANFNLIGVAMPEGAREVELRFVDAAYERGKVITLVALGFAVLATAVGAVIGRRRLPSASGA